MIRLYSLLWMLLLPCCLAGQPRSKAAKHVAKRKYNAGIVAAVQPPPEVFVTVEQRPQFPGGEAALERYLSLNMVYPPMARESEVQGKVLVRFMVDTDGSTNHIEVIKGIGFGCDQEAIRVVKAMPRWTPGKLNGRPVRAVYILPVNFRIDR